MSMSGTASVPDQPPPPPNQQTPLQASTPSSQTQAQPDGFGFGAPTPSADASQPMSAMSNGTPRSGNFPALPPGLTGPTPSPSQSGASLPQGIPPQLMTSLMSMSNGSGFSEQQAQHARNLIAHMAANQAKMGGSAGGLPGASGSQTSGSPSQTQQPAQQDGEQRRVSGQQDLASMASAMGMLGNMQGGANKDAMLRQLQVLTQAARARQQVGSPTAGVSAPSPSGSSSAMPSAPSPATSFMNGGFAGDASSTPNRAMSQLPFNPSTPTDAGPSRLSRPSSQSGPTPSAGGMGPPIQLPAGMDPQVFMNLSQQQKEFIFTQQRLRNVQLQQQQQQQIGMGRPNSNGGEARTPSSQSQGGGMAQVSTPQAAQTAPSPAQAQTPMAAPSPALSQTARLPSGPTSAVTPTADGAPATAGPPSATSMGAVRPVRPPASRYDPAEQRRQFLISLGSYYRASGTSPPPEIFNGERDGCIKMGNVGWVELADLFMFVMRAGGVTNIVKHGQDSSVWQHFLSTKQIPNPLPEAVTLPRQIGLEANTPPTTTTNPIQFLMAVFFVYLQGFETYMTRQRQMGVALRQQQQAAAAAAAAGGRPPPPMLPQTPSSAVIAPTPESISAPSPLDTAASATMTGAATPAADAPTPATTVPVTAPIPAAPAPGLPAPSPAATVAPSPAVAASSMPPASHTSQVASSTQDGLPQVSGPAGQLPPNAAASASSGASRPTPAPIRTDLPMPQTASAATLNASQPPPPSAATPTASSASKKRKKKGKDSPSGSNTPAMAAPSSLPSTSGMPPASATPGPADAASAPPQPKRPRYKVEYRPIHHPRQHLAGWDERAVASTFPKHNLADPTRSIHELGIVDMEAVLMGLRSRLARELGYALTVLSMLSMPHPEENIGGLPLHHLREIYEELLGLIEEAAFGEDGFAAWDKRVSGETVEPAAHGTEGSAEQSAQVNGDAHRSQSPSARTATPSQARLDPNMMPFAQLEQLGRDFDFSLDDDDVDEAVAFGGRSRARSADGRSTDIVLAGLNILRNFSMLPDNQSLMAQVPDLFHLLGKVSDARLARLPGQTASPDRPFSVVEIARLRRDAVVILTNLGAHVDLRAVSPSSVTAVFRLLSTFLRSGWDMLVQREPVFGPLPSARSFPPPMILSVNYALEAFCNLSHYDSNREVLGRLPADELVALFEGILKLFPVSKRGFEAMSALEDSLAFVECLALSLYSLVFLSSQAARTAMRAVPGALAIVVRLIAMTAVQGQGADPKQNPFAVLCRRLCETLAVLNGTVSASGDAEVMSFSAGREAPPGKEGKGWSFQSKVVEPGWLAGDEERLVMAMLSRGLDGVAHTELDAMLWAA